MEPLAEHAVTYNGVTFLPGDLNALLSLASTRVSSRGIAGRCNGNDSMGGVIYDEDGRAIQSECRDVNPGSLYVIAANMLGLQHRGFVVDRTMDAQVWNQPVRGYRITKLEEISSQRAQQLVTDRAAAAGMNEILVQDQMYGVSPGHPIRESGTFQAPGGKISLVARGTGSIAVWLFTGPSFDDTPEASRCYTGRGAPSSLSCQLTALQGEQVRWVMKVYGHSRVTLGYGTESAGGTGYQFNVEAVRFFDVAMELHWIQEAGPSSEIWDPQSFVDAHTKIDRYTFVLEVDAHDNIIGGEYTGDSKRFHADFLWYPTARPSNLRLDSRYELDYDLLRRLNASAAE